MSKNFVARFRSCGLAAALVTSAATALPAAAQATTLGPAAARCNNNDAAVLVDVSGFKERSGTLRVQIYQANPRTYLDRGQWLERVEVPVARAGSMRVCVPVPSPGNYVVAVRHDVNNTGKTDRNDGAGMSGNPRMRLPDVLARRKPPLDSVRIAVGTTTRQVPVTLNYIQGLSFGPVR